MSIVYTMCGQFPQFSVAVVVPCSTRLSMLSIIQGLQVSLDCDVAVAVVQTCCPHSTMAACASGDCMTIYWYAFRPDFN